MIRRVAALVAACLLGSLPVAVPLAAAASTGASTSTGSGAEPAGGPFPEVIPLPDGWQPEGIAVAGPVAYFGSLANGSIYRADLLTGLGEVLSVGPNTPSVGMKVGPGGRLFVSGGPAGDARVVDTRTGEVLASYRLHAAPTFVNDVWVTPDAAWFTDSFNPFLYKLPLRGGDSLPTQAEVVAVPLTGDIVYGPGFNANGITRTPDGRGLLIVQSNTGLLFRVDPATGVARTVDLGGYVLTAGDGILVEGTTLYVVQNVLNIVAVFRLDNGGTRGTLVDRLTDPRLDVPTTVATFADRLYLPNARFGTTPTPTTSYTAVAITP